MLLLLLLACTDCPEGSSLRDDGICYLDDEDEVPPPDDTAGDAAPPEDSGGLHDTAQPKGGCPAELSTDTYDAYPVYIDGTDRRFATIQDGIWGSEDGDVVTVCPGTYAENIDFKGKPITVTSAEGPWVTIIDGQGLDSVVTLKNYESPASILQGFTLTNGNALASNHGGGIYIEWGSPTIRYNVIVHNQARIAGGVYVRNGVANIHNNIIAWNEAMEGGGGIVCTACVGSVRYNTLLENRCGQGPVGEWFWGTADLTGNVMVSQEIDTGAVLRWLKPRGDDFETGYNLAWPHTAMVDGTNKADWPEGDGMVWAAAGLVDPEGMDFALSPESPARDAGPPHDLDPDGSRADMGAYGGPDGEWPW